MRGVRFVELDASRRVTRHAVDQVNNKLGIPYWRADALAARLNSHIALIWPDHALDLELDDTTEPGIEFRPMSPVS